MLLEALSVADEPSQFPDGFLSRMFHGLGSVSVELDSERPPPPDAVDNGVAGAGEAVRAVRLVSANGANGESLDLHPQVWSWV